MAVQGTLAYVPVWVASVRNSRTSHRFGWSITPEDRKRMYLSMTVTGKRFAQELRAFGLAAPLRRRYDDLYDARIAKIRDVTAKRLRRSLVASVANSALSALSIALLVVLLGYFGGAHGLSGNPAAASACVIRLIASH